MLALLLTRIVFPIPVVFPRLSSNVNEPLIVDADPGDTASLLIPSPISDTEVGTVDGVFPLPVVLIVEMEFCRDCELIELRESPELMLGVSETVGRPAVSGGTILTTYFCQY